MFFERSDRDFIQAASGPAERDALLRRLRRSRQLTVFFLLATVAIGLGCGALTVQLLLHSVEAAARSLGGEGGAETGLNAAIGITQILKFVLFAIVFQLPFTFIHLFRLDTSIKLLLYLEGREQIPANGLGK
jgi:hypothetical protein